MSISQTAYLAHCMVYFIKYRKFGNLCGDIIYANYACAVSVALIRTRKVFNRGTATPTSARCLRRYSWQLHAREGVKILVEQS